jgi:hypothetical protein
MTVTRELTGYRQKSDGKVKFVFFIAYVRFIMMTKLTRIYEVCSNNVQTFFMYTVRQLYNETDFILTKIEVQSMKQCMPSKCPTFIWSREQHGAESEH